MVGFALASGFSLLYMTNYSINSPVFTNHITETNRTIRQRPTLSEIIRFSRIAFEPSMGAETTQFELCF